MNPMYNEEEIEFVSLDELMEDEDDLTEEDWLEQEQSRIPPTHLPLDFGDY